MADISFEHVEIILFVVIGTAFSLWGIILATPAGGNLLQGHRPQTGATKETEGCFLIFLGLGLLMAARWLF